MIKLFSSTFKSVIATVEGGVIYSASAASTIDL